MPATIHVDVVRPGVALITHSDHSGYVNRDGKRYRLEDTDSGEYIAHVASYKAAGHRFATWHGITDYTVNVDFE